MLMAMQRLRRGGSIQVQIPFPGLYGPAQKGLTTLWPHLLPLSPVTLLQTLQTHLCCCNIPHSSLPQGLCPLPFPTSISLHPGDSSSSTVPQVKHLCFGAALLLLLGPPPIICSVASCTCSYLALSCLFKVSCPCQTSLFPVRVRTLVHCHLQQC